MSTVVQYLNENGLSYLWTKIQGINPSYNNTNSGLTATTMQDAIDELATGSSAIPSTITPLMDGTAAVGTSTAYARADHVHPSDTSKVNYIEIPLETDIDTIVNDGWYYCYASNYIDDNEAEDYNCPFGSVDFTLHVISGEGIIQKAYNAWDGIIYEKVRVSSNDTWSNWKDNFSDFVQKSGDTMTGTLKAIDINSTNDEFKEVISAVTKNDVLAIDSTLTSSSTIAAWQTALLKAICAKYPNRSETVFKGHLSPGSRAWYEVFIYDTSNLSSGLPLYSFGLWRQYNNTFIKFWTSSYAFNSADVDTNTTYSASSPISLSGTTFSHANSGATSGTYGTNNTTALTPGFGSTFNVIGMAINATGHVTSAASHTVKIPNSTATTAANGLMTTAQVTKLNGIATSATAGVSGGTTSTVVITLGSIAAHNYVSGKTATVTVPSGYNINRCYLRGWYIQGTTRNTYVNIYNINIAATMSISAANMDSSTATSSDTKVSVYLGWIK